MRFYLEIYYLIFCLYKGKGDTDMKKHFSFVKSKLKKFIIPGSIVLASIIIPASLYAWGPARQTFTTAAPANYITFNSITDNPAHGDERNFMQVRANDAGNNTYSDSIALTPGKDYLVYMYYHNNAAANLNLTATGTYAKAQIPAVVANGSTGTKAVGYIGASNATPTEVWDDISFSNTSGGDIALRFVPGSAKIYNFGTTNGATLSDSIITSGATLGYNALDGNIPGCSQYSGYVTFMVRADQPNFTVTKQVRLAGTTTWSKSLGVKNGDTVDYQIEYKNIGSTDENNVILKDALPTGITYVAGSTFLKNASNPSAKNVSDNLVSASGLNIGNYTPGSNAYIKFSATVSDAKIACGSNSLTNTGSASTANGTKSDTAIVTITKNCVTPSNLPTTGPSGSILSIIAIGLLTASVSYYVVSRRQNV